MGNKQTFRETGLTLVELLVAISILGLVAVIGWRGLDSIVRSRFTLSENLEQTRGMQLAFAQLQSDCAQLATPAALPEMLTISLKNNQISLIRSVYADDQPTRLQVVTYHIVNEQLYRRESVATRDMSMLYQSWLSAFNETNPDPGISLQKNVASISMRIWLKGGNEWDQPNQITNTGPGLLVPTGLEVVLHLKGQKSDLTKNFLLGAI